MAKTKTSWRRAEKGLLKSRKWRKRGTTIPKRLFYVILENIKSEPFRMSNVAALSYKSNVTRGKKNNDRPQPRSKPLSSYRPQERARGR